MRINRRWRQTAPRSQEFQDFLGDIKGLESSLGLKKAPFLLA
jgi:hypothetical protein